MIAFKPNTRYTLIIKHKMNGYRAFTCHVNDVGHFMQENTIKGICSVVLIFEVQK